VPSLAGFTWTLLHVHVNRSPHTAWRTQDLVLLDVLCRLSGGDLLQVSRSAVDRARRSARAAWDATPADLAFAGWRAGCRSPRSARTSRRARPTC
jgi:hypothetical protein